MLPPKLMDLIDLVQRWWHVDWRKDDATIAAELGVPVQAVLVQRAHRCPDSLTCHHDPEWDQVDWRLTNGQIAARLQRPLEDVRRARQRLRVRAKATDWTGVDWTQSDAQIARRLGKSRETVKFRRWTFAPHTGDLVRRTEKWRAVDWSRSNPEIAALMGVTVASVQYRRRTLAPAALQAAERGRRPRLTVDQWAALDWSRPDAALAAELGIGITALRVRRVRHAPPELRHTAPRRLAAAVWARVDWAQPDPEIAHALGVSRQAVSQQRRRRQPAA